jgi:hypothetical protein
MSLSFIVRSFSKSEMSNADHRRLPMGGMEILIPWFARIVSRDTFRGGFQFCPAWFVF